MINNEEYTLALESCYIALNNIRGQFYPNKNFGMSIKAGADTLPKRLLAYGRQACQGIDGVYLKSVQINGKYALFDILVNGEKGQVSINLE